MANFYDRWLSYWDDEQEERAKARKVIHDEELEWVKTKQDYRAALVCGRENGFITAGAVMIGAMPKGWHTGKHSHGEEAIYILEGQGFSVVDGEKYEWDKGSCLFMPYGSVHQHFNSGESEARYISATAIALERFAGLAKIMQYEECGETAMNEPKGVVPAKSDIHPEYGRIVLKSKDVPALGSKDWGKKQATRKDEFTQSLAKEMLTSGKGHHSRTLELMGLPDNGFKAREVEMTSILCDAAGTNSGRHAHMEALIYRLQGEGYTVVDGEKIPWKKGTFTHIQGPQTVHQHFVTGKEEGQGLRIHFGLRSNFYQKTAQRVFPYLYYEFGTSGD